MTSSIIEWSSTGASYRKCSASTRRNVPRSRLEFAATLRSHLCLLSCQCPSGHCTKPHHQETHDYAEHDIKAAIKPLTLLNGPQRFVFEGRKRRISANKADWNQVSPVRAEMHSVCQYGHRYADYKASRHVDDKRAIGKPCAHTLTDVCAQKESCDGTHSTAGSDDDVFQCSMRPFSSSLFRIFVIDSPQSHSRFRSSPARPNLFVVQRGLLV